MKRLTLLLVVLAAAVSLLAAGLRPDAFFVGDQGVKLIAARNAINHPTRPFEIALPTIGPDRVPHVEPFFSVHGDHTHAVTSTLFAVLSAPLLHVIGFRGLYILPALGFLLSVAGCAAIATALDRRRQAAVTALAAALGTPFLFYGLEYWEHSLSLGCATAAAAFLLHRRAFAGGLLFGAASLLRPEAGWFTVATLIASPWLPKPLSRREWMLVVAGALVAVIPFQGYTLTHFGTLFPPHLRTNAATLGEGWRATRVSILGAWFASVSYASFWRATPLLACAVLSTALPSERLGRRFLWTTAAANIVLVVLTAPNDGGGQWGPRYLLFAYVPLAILAADTVDAVPRKSVVAVALTAAVLAALWTQRSAYRHLQGTKATYGRIVDFLAARTPPGVSIVTDLWWLDQVAASVTANRQVLFAPDSSAGHGIVQRLSDVVAPVVTVVRSASESPDTGNWIGNSCYHEIEREKISLRNIVAITLRHRCT